MPFDSNHEKDRERFVNLHMRGIYATNAEIKFLKLVVIILAVCLFCGLIY